MGFHWPLTKASRAAPGDRPGRAYRSRRDDARVHACVDQRLGRALDERLQRIDGDVVRRKTRNAQHGGIPEEDLGERLADDRGDPEASQALRRVLARGAAAEIPVHDEHRRPVVSGIVEGVRRGRPCGRLRTGAVRGLRRSRRRRNRAGMIRSVSRSSPRTGNPRPVTEVMEDMNLILALMICDRAFGIGSDAQPRIREELRDFRFQLLQISNLQSDSSMRTSSSMARTSTTSPATAAAATMAGLMSSVRPVGLP